MLIALAAILVLGASWALVGALGGVSKQVSAQREHNARVLGEAKAALIGWIAANALDGSDNNPGRLPCPQNWGDVGSSNEGRAGTCSTPAVGWLPWRTLGLSKLLDASGQQLWYVISPGWYVPGGGGTLTINSSTAAQLTLDGSPAVALIIAPGAALKITPNPSQSAAGCTARSQTQALNLPTTSPNVLDFLDCQNGSTADNVFTTSVIDNAANTVFNDQVLAVTTADILPALEGAIAKRIENQVIPSLKTAYVGTKWNASAADTVFPFAASFTPDGPAASSYQGSAGVTQGLLPFSYSPPCSPAGDARCTSSTFHAWGTPALSKVGGSGALYQSPSCSVSGGTITCQGWYMSGSLQVKFDDPVSNVANALRDFNLADHTVVVWSNLCKLSGGVCSWDGYQTETSTLSRRFNSNGSLSFIVTSPLRWTGGKDWGYYYIQAQRPAIIDHSLLSASTTSSTGWFVRNEWYRLLYYAVASPHVPGGTLSCVSGSTCLQVTNLTDGTKQQAILALAGRALSTQTRPSSSLENYLDSAENRNLDSLFVQSTVDRLTFNDRFISLSKNP